MTLKTYEQQLEEVQKAITDVLTGAQDASYIQKGQEYAILTDEIYKGWAGLSARDYKRLKGLTKENLRDNMTNLELVLNMLAEVSTTDLAKDEQPKGLAENLRVARKGANVASAARKEYEASTGRKAITGRNAKELKKITATKK